MAAEHDDLMFSWGHFFFTLNEKAIEPPGEAVSNAELFRRLAKRFGFTEPQFSMSEAQQMEHFIDWASPKMGGIDMAYLREHGWYRLNLGDPKTRTPHGEGNFPTASGKCEFYSEGAAAGGDFVAPPFRQMYHGLPRIGTKLDPPAWLCAGRASGRRPIQARRAALPAQYHFAEEPRLPQPRNMPRRARTKSRSQGEQAILINPADAVGRSIVDGVAVRVFNDRGTFHGNAKVTEDVPAGVVVASLGYWHALNKGAAVNVVSSSALWRHGPLADLQRQPSSRSGSPHKGVSRRGRDTLPATGRRAARGVR